MSVAMTGNVNASGDIVRPAPFYSYNPLITQDLRTDHPVGLIYESPAKNPASVAGLSTAISLSGPPFYVQVSGNNVFPIFGGTGDGSSKFECASCHDPHTTVNVKFLRDNPLTICTDCHVSK